MRMMGLLLLGGGLMLNSACSSKSKPDAGRADAKAYSGVGAESVSPEDIKSFAAPALEPELSRKIQMLLDVRSPGGGMLHANKKELFFTWRVTGTTQVWRLKSPQGFPIQMTGGEDATSIAGQTPDGKWLILSRDRAGEENPGLYLQSTEGGSLKVIQHTAKVQTSLSFITDDSRYLYYRANNVDPSSYAIYKYDLKTSKSELIFSEKGYWLIADEKQNGRLLLQKVISNTASEFFLFDEKSKKLTPILGQGEQEEYSVSFSPTDGEYIVLTNKFSEYRRLYVWDGAKKWKAISDENLKFDVSSFEMDHPRKHLIYVINEGGYSRARAIDPKTLREIKLPAFPDADHVVPGTSTRDGEAVMLLVMTGKSPRQSYSYSWRTGKLTQWVIPSVPEVDLRKFVEAKLEYYKAKDGTSIPMFVRRPPQCVKSAKPCPVVVHFHGGPEAQSDAGFSVLSQMFVDEGFIYVEPNVRGSDGYGKAWLHSDNGAKRLQVITDVPDCADWIKANWKAGGQAPKVGVMGWSYGGYSTLMAMTKFAGHYDAGVALVGMSDLKTFLKNTAPYRRALRMAEYGDPEKDSEALDQLSAIRYLDQVKGPVLIIQGVSDPRVPAGEAVQMHRAMRAKGLSSELILFADEGHGSAKRSNQVLELGHTVGFFKKHL